ncbi:MAG: amino-acid N-acetyltransferase, partial [Ectothiorhodospiraceae bacterium]
MTEDLSRLVQWFRRSSPYINAHRGRTVVVSVGGEAMEDGSLPRLVHDLALLNSLGIRVVLVAGAR